MREESESIRGHQSQSGAFRGNHSGYHEGGIRGSSVKSSVLAKYGATHAR